MDRHILASLFAPRSIVVFAGDPDAADAPTPQAATLRQALKTGAGEAGSFAGEVTWLDIAMTGTLGDLAASRADLALIALAPGELAPALEIVGRIRCRAALILNNGLPAAQCNDLHQIARRYGVHLLGPNSLGFQNPRLKLNASTLGPLARPGPLGLVSQSGALTASILDWAQANGVGFSNVISLGANTAVDLPQALDYLANDGQTQSILVYMEGIRSARRFMSALRAAAYAKPVVVMKAGRKPAGSTAALTHSASIVGSDDVFDAALRRAGVVRVRVFTQLFSAAKCLASRFRPVGRRLAIVTNGGGPGVLAADWAEQIGLAVSGVHDLGEDAGAAAYRSALEAALADRGADGVLMIHSPKAGSASEDSPEAIARAVGETFSPAGKPVLACWMGDSTVRAAREALNAVQIPSFRTPEAAVDSFNSIASFYRNQQLLQQTPPPLGDGAVPDTEGARLLIEGVLAERRKVLTEMESKALLAAFHIPVTRTMLARSANEAMLIASQLGYPVALKIDSPDISHKSDVQGVVLDVHTAAQVRDRYAEVMAAVQRNAPNARINGITVQPMARAGAGAQNRGMVREVYVGLSTDDPFGPVITFGAGGTMVELINDRAIELPPLNQFLARRLIERSRVADALGEWRGAPAANTEALEQVLLRVSEMVCALPQLREMDINPILVDEAGAVAVDARIVVDHAPNSVMGTGTAGSYQHLAILPYPSSQEREWPMKGGGLYTIRPIHPDDAEMLQAFVRGMSEESRYFRFASTMPELPARMLARYTLIDYDREMALVAVVKQRAVQPDGSVQEHEELIGVSRYITNPDQTSCEFSLAVADDYKGQGLGSRLMLSIIDVARSRGLAEIVGLILANNSNMLRLMGSLGFTLAPFPEDPDFRLASKAL
ncbi:MAG: GNAT family N-acetyltransferase [Rubrivivax sp.]